MRAWKKVCVGAAFLSAIVLYLWSTTPYGNRVSQDRPAPTCLQELSMAQLEFRNKDADQDGKANFWRADIAGLYAHAPGGGPAIKLAPLWIASADDRPVVSLSSYSVPSTHGGYWYRAIRHAEENPQALRPDRFAFCAYPDSASAGKYLYVCDEQLRIFRSPANGRRGIDVFPTQEQLKAEWNQVD